MHSRPPRANLTPEIAAHLETMLNTITSPRTRHHWDPTNQANSSDNAWALPSDSTYVPRHIGFSTDNTYFGLDVKPTDTTRTIGTWSTLASPGWANAWIHVKGPYDRRYVTGTNYPGL